MKLKLILMIAAALWATPLVQARVFVLVEENHDYSEVIGNPSMPYLNNLAQSYALATNYYAVTHPSIGNYFTLTTGQIITNNDAYGSTVYVDNIVRRINAAGLRWKEYSESLPRVGYYGGDSGYYTRHHNPCSYFSDVRNDRGQQANLVPFTQLAADIAAGTLPDFGLIIPDDRHNSHSGTLAAADSWLQDNIPPLIAALRCDDLLVIVYDESSHGRNAYGGGHVAWVAIGPSVRRPYVSTTFFQHRSTLRLVCDQLGIATPTPAAAATPMGEFFLP